MMMRKKIRVIMYKEVDLFLNTLIVATHGFIKKAQKTPQKEICKADTIRRQYFEAKKLRYGK